MEQKKRLTILVILALVLAITAIVLNVTSSEISTSKPFGVISGRVSQVGIDIQPVPIEDRLAGETQGGQS